MSTVADIHTSAAGQSRQLAYDYCNRLLQEIGQLSEADQPPGEYHAEFLKRALAGTGAAAGAVWRKTPAGHIRAEHEINLASLALNGAEDAGHHDDLLRHAFQAGQPMAVSPRNSTGSGNPSKHIILLTPILVDGQVAALVEVCLERAGGPAEQAACGQFLVGMAHYASIYVRNHQRRTLVGQQNLWQRLETFSRQAHATLDLDTVAYTVANQGRQLVECDRLSVVRRSRGRARVEAVSGVDVVEQRSNQVRLLGALCARVIAWGEKLVYRGEPDPSLPPAVLRALDRYLAESNSKLLIVYPLHDEEQPEKPPAFALAVESFEDGAATEQMLARLEVVGRHAGGALANAAAYRHIPFHWFWQPLGNLREMCGGPVGAVILLVAGLLIALVAAMICLTWPLKMEANGQVLPRERRWLYSPVEGKVVRFEQGVQPGSIVAENQSLLLMYDVQLELKLVQLANDIAAAQDEIAALAAQQQAAHNEAERLGFASERKQKEYIRNRKLAELKAVQERAHADPGRPGYFWLTSPLGGTVLNWDFREKLTNRSVKPSDPLLRIGDKGRGWEVELKIGNRQIGEVLEAFTQNPGAELDVDLMLLSAPTRTFRGKLSRQQMAAEALPDRESEQPEAVVWASVRIDGPDIPVGERVPHELLVSGAAIHARIRCGEHRMVYSLFHGVWEFICEKVLLF